MTETALGSGASFCALGVPREGVLPGRQRTTWEPVRATFKVCCLAAAVAVTGCSTPSKSYDSAGKASPVLAQGRSAPDGFRVISVLMGRAIEANNTISARTRVFHPDDTIYLSVISDRHSSGETSLRVRWSYGPQALLVAEQAVEVPAWAGSNATEVHVSKSSGWPLGVYAVEVFIEGQSAVREEFEVVDEVATDDTSSEFARPVCRIKRDNKGRIARDRHQVTLFRASHPCPGTGKLGGVCHGYVVDHICPLSCCGADDPSNMQWQTVAEGKAKDAWEQNCSSCTAGSPATGVAEPDQ